ncbi:MAG: zinc-dependent alcohol dehydrogenase family protein [Bacteroidota bacterium]
MKAVWLDGRGPIENEPLCYREVEDPVPRDGEILIKIKACGICHTDLHIVEGELPPQKSPVIPGHQIVGEVAKTGPEASRFQTGDRVGVPWLHWTCGKCGYCTRGLENLCENARFTGYHVDGGFAQYAVAPESFVYAIPEKFSDVEAAPLLCAGIIGFRALRLCEIRPGDRLGLFGFGASAHLAIQVARHWGCEVYVFTRSDEHRKLAQELGAAWTGRAEDRAPHPVDSAVMFAPAGHLVHHALQALRKGGTLALAGIYMTPVPELEYKLLYDERTMRSVANSTRQDAIDFLKVAAEIPVCTEVETFPLKEANRVLRLLKQSKIRAAGVFEIG